MKYLRTTMPDASQWDVPAELIAKSRAAYYAQLDSERGEGSYDAIYALELDYTLAAPDELEDWAANNMNWSDVSHAAMRRCGCRPAQARRLTTRGLGERRKGGRRKAMNARTPNAEVSRTEGEKKS